ncbi:sigma-54 dependent transcriptional regulator [bacterium]|nr:sigma-54 dependent transcriptional regulator [bacterium]
MSKIKMLIIDDEPIVLDYLTTALERFGYEPVRADSGERAIELLEKHEFTVVISDFLMPGINGLVVLDHIQRNRPDLPVIILTAHGSIENAVEAMSRGAFHYLTKPIDPKLLKLTLERAMEKRQLIQENRNLRQHIIKEQGLNGLIGSSAPMKQMMGTLKKVAAQPVDVLVTGASGTGKELVARALHWSSPRAKNPFIKMNCAALPENLVESELFGHEKGSFTGAHRARKGKFESAHNGTILLDEISEMSPNLQAKLLRVLQEREFDKIGSNDPVKVDVRVVATSNKNLKEAVADGSFREDLFYRLNVVQVNLPPLSQRLDDIPALVTHFVNKYGERYGREFEGVRKEALDYLKSQRWQGNVRELENRIERAIVLANSLWIELEDVQYDGGLPINPSASIDSFGPIPLHELEKMHILKTLTDLSFNRTKTAELLGISIRTLRNKLNEYRDQGEDIPKGN